MEELKREITKSLAGFQILEIVLKNRISDLYKIIQERTADVMCFKIPPLKNKTMGQLINLLSELNLVAHAAFAHVLLGEEDEINKIQVNVEKWITDTVDIARSISSQNIKRYKLELAVNKEELRVREEEQRVHLEHLKKETDA